MTRLRHRGSVLLPTSLVGGRGDWNKLNEFYSLLGVFCLRVTQSSFQIHLDK